MIDSLDIFEMKENEFVWIGSARHVDEAVYLIHGHRKTSSLVVLAQMTGFASEHQKTV